MATRPRPADFPPPPVPPKPTPAALSAAVQRCRACDLYERATRRIHQRPDHWHVRACFPWLDSELAELVTLTVHPSSILRVRERDERHLAMDAFVGDLGMVADWLSHG